MARGRFISKEICIDKRVNSLTDPWAIVAFTWLITHADVEGRTYGDADIVRSLIFPRQPNITVDMVEGYLVMLSEAELILRYEVDGDQYIEFPNFSKHQVGLRKDREPESTLPEYCRKVAGRLPEGCRNNAGSFPAEVKLSKVEVKDEVEVEVEVAPPSGGDNITKHDLKHFAEITHIKAPTDQKRIAEWMESLVRFREMGVTDAIIRQAQSELAGKRYNITGPKSLEVACANVLGRTKHERPRDSDGEYGAFIHR